MARTLDRRSLLRLAGATGLLTLAACSAPAAPSSPAPAATAAPKSTQPPKATEAPQPAPSPAAKTAPTAAPTARKAPVKWKWGVMSPKVETAFQMIAAEKGFFSEVGLDMEIPILGNDADATKALIAGELQITETSPTQPLAAIAKGAEMKLIGAFNQGLTHALFVRKDINDVKDLAGKNVGITTPGSLPHVITVAVMEKKGVDTNGVNWVNVGASATAVQALAAGKIDAAAASFEYGAVVEKENAGKQLLLFRDELPEYFKGTLQATDKLIKEQPELIGNFMVAYGKGIRYAMEHKDETLALAEKITKQTLVETVPIYDFTVNRKLIEPNGLIDPAKLQFMQKLNVQFKLQTEVLPAEKVANWDFQRKVISVIGEYKK